MKSLMKVELLRITRNKKYLLMSIAMPVAFYLIFTAVINIPDPESQKLFMKEYLISMTTFSLTSFSIFTFPFEIIQDKKNGWRTLLNRLPIKTFEIYLIKIIKMLLLFILAILLVFLTGFLVRKVEMTAQQWIISALLLLFGATIFLSLGTLLSNFKDEKTVSVFANILFLGLAMLGGLWFPTDQFPGWLQTISKLTPTYHFRELAVGYIENGLVPLNSVLIMISYGVVFLGISFLISRKREDVS
ncbi:ABC transporter permease [Enterococcus timonensis]|uniref:ABC transporter permease n=1 Tax=Enterococcus timonensis TaxID=1852364 RepID=UPI0008D98966|nr:ABC transporter permease [Enterococcus timonensis]